MKQLLGVVLFVTVFAINEAVKDQFLAVTYNKDTEVLEFATEKSKQSVAWAVFKNDINSTLWAYLEVYTDNTVDDATQAYAAGLAEGTVTQDLLKMHWYNTMDRYCAEPLTPYCKRLRDYLRANFDWVAAQIKANPHDAYWHQVALFIIQMNGLQDGFNGKIRKPSFEVEDVFGMMVLWQVAGDLEDLETVLKKGTIDRPVGSGSCSALIKLLPGNKELYVSQVTWTGYQMMLRIIKKYDFKFSIDGNKGSGLIPGQVMTFSSYPGALVSGDDFYLISSGLVAQETTIGNGNSDIWKYVTPTGTVVEAIRNMVANRLATSGKQWAAVFSNHNSGTYNNQWMIVDYKLFKPGKPLNPGLLYIIEQIPGLIHSEDMTHLLQKQTYWPSYNVAYFKDVFNTSGGPAMVAKYGDWFTYDHTARANIFRRDHSKVNDLATMVSMMRYNNFQHDPLSKCDCDPPYSGENAIAGRSDLNPANGTYPFGALSHRNHGGTDAKITSYGLFQSLEMIACGGPTYDQVPPFQWSKADFGPTTRHVGHPDKFTFTPIVHKWRSRGDY